MINNWQLLVLVFLFLATIGWGTASITIAIREQTTAVHQIVDHLHGSSRTTVRIEETFPHFYRF